MGKVMQETHTVARHFKMTPLLLIAVRSLTIYHRMLRHPAVMV